MPDKIVGTMIARNEDWVLRASAECALRWCDSLVLVDHASTDTTPAIIADLQKQYGERIVSWRIDEPTWHEAAYRQAMLIAARGIGATVVAIIDADEMLTENLIPLARSFIASIKSGAVLRAHGLCVTGVNPWSYVSVEDYFISLVFRDAPYLRWTTDDAYDIHCRAPIGCSSFTPINVHGGVLHLQHLVRRRLLAKQALYKMVERLRWNADADAINQKYDATVSLNVPTQSIPKAFMTRELGLIDLAATPWQEEECKRLMKVHGNTFEGLNLYGVV